MAKKIELLKPGCLEERASKTVIALMRHQATAYASMQIPRINWL